MPTAWSSKASAFRAVVCSGPPASRPAPLLETLGVTADRAGRLQVGADCSIPGHPDIFVIGDAASFTQGDKPLPGVAQVAIQQGTYVGKLIARRVTGRPSPPPFKYFDKGNMATIGRGYAILDGFGVRMAGRMASIVWAIIHVQFLAANTMRLATITAVGGERADQSADRPA